MTTPNTTAPAGDDEGLPELSMDAEIECAALVAWNSSAYAGSAEDTVHPMWLHGFRRGFRAGERPISDQMRSAIAAKDAELAEAVEANNMKDLQIAELRERLAELRDIAEQLIACHDEPLCPAVAVAKERIAALAAKGEGA